MWHLEKFARSVLMDVVYVYKYIEDGNPVMVSWAVTSVKKIKSIKARRVYTIFPHFLFFCHIPSLYFCNSVIASFLPDDSIYFLTSGDTYRLVFALINSYGIIIQYYFKNPQ